MTSITNQHGLDLQGLANAAGPNLEPDDAKRAADLAERWEASEHAAGTWNDAQAREKVRLLDGLTFKHERWLTVQYDLGSIDYGPRRAIYTRAFPNWMADALTGGEKYAELAELLSEIWAAQRSNRDHHFTGAASMWVREEDRHLLEPWLQAVFA